MTVSPYGLLLFGDVKTHIFTYTIMAKFAEKIKMKSLLN